MRKIYTKMQCISLEIDSLKFILQYCKEFQKNNAFFLFNVGIFSMEHLENIK